MRSAIIASVLSSCEGNNGPKLQHLGFPRLPKVYSRWCYQSSTLLYSMAPGAPVGLPPSDGLPWWACSFDIIRDELGGPRSIFPHTLTIAAGTQAAHARQNAIALVKLSNLGQGKHGAKVGKPFIDCSLQSQGGWSWSINSRVPRVER